MKTSFISPPLREAPRALAQSATYLNAIKLTPIFLGQTLGDSRQYYHYPFPEFHHYYLHNDNKDNDKTTIDYHQNYKKNYFLLLTTISEMLAIKRYRLIIQRNR
ncbi:MAG: hypothetical protein IKK20_03355, partial [Clostridia bacterium]|nr:hypothetical protein [Clostridia bacterium]